MGLEDDSDVAEGKTLWWKRDDHKARVCGTCAKKNRKVSLCGEEEDDFDTKQGCEGEVEYMQREREGEVGGGGSWWGEGRWGRDCWSATPPSSSTVEQWPWKLFWTAWGWRLAYFAWLPCLPATRFAFFRMDEEVGKKRQKRKRHTEMSVEEARIEEVT